MKPIQTCLLLIILSLTAALAHAQLLTKPTNLDFKQGQPGGVPTGWLFPPDCKQGGYDALIVETNGQRSAKIFASAKPAPEAFGTLFQSIDATPYRGKRIRIQGKLRADPGGEVGKAMLWLRVDRPNGQMGFFDNMGDRPVKNSEGQDCVIVGDVAHDAKTLVFGFMLIGTGEAWLSNVSFEIVGKDVPTTGPKLPGPGISTAKGSYAFKAIADVAEPKIAFPMPLLFERQVPLDFELKTTPPDSIKTVVYKERKPSDWIVEVTFNPVKKGQRIDISWQSDVLIALADLSGLLATATLPDVTRLPADIKPWLAATRSVQSKHPEIIAQAGKVRTAPDLMIIARNIALVPASIKLAGPQTLDAVEALKKGGSCTSCANLAAALLRANGIPTRILACYPTWAGPLQTHYVVQYYRPNQGWIWMESTMGQTPITPYQDVIVAVVYPEDEERSFDPGRWSAPGVPYLSLTENLGDPNFALWRMMIDPEKGCDHIATFNTPLTETDPTEWNHTLDLAKSLWKAYLQNLQKSQPPTEALLSAQRNAAAAKSLEDLNTALQKIKKQLPPNDK